jgi:hypothetical protein
MCAADTPDELGDAVAPQLIWTFKMEFFGLE